MVTGLHKPSDRSQRDARYVHQLPQHQTTPPLGTGATSTRTGESSHGSSLSVKRSVHVSLHAAVFAWLLARCDSGTCGVRKVGSRGVAVFVDESTELVVSIHVAR